MGGVKLNTHCKAVCDVAMVILWTSHLIIAVNFLYSYVWCDTPAKHIFATSTLLVIEIAFVFKIGMVCAFATKLVSNYLCGMKL